MPPWLVNLLSNRLFWVMLFVVGIPTLKFIVRTISAARAKKIAYDSVQRREEEYLRTGRTSDGASAGRQVSAREELEQMAARRRAEFERARSVAGMPTPMARVQMPPSMQPPPMPVDAPGGQPRSTRSPAELAQRRARAEERAKREARQRQQQEAQSAHDAAVERQAREDAEDKAAAQQRRRTVANLASMGEAAPAPKGAARAPRQREELAMAAAGQPYTSTNWRRAIVLAEVLSTPVSLR